MSCPKCNSVHTFPTPETAYERFCAGCDHAWDIRDEEAAEWNLALAGGDEDEIELIRERNLASIHKRIMDDDPQYREAGWQL